jgi:hypothetical protein
MSSEFGLCRFAKCGRCSSRAEAVLGLDYLCHLSTDAVVGRLPERVFGLTGREWSCEL